jgi:hypothetical protein
MVYQQGASVPNDAMKAPVSPKSPRNTAGMKRWLPLFFEDEEETTKKVKRIKPAKVIAQASDDERSPTPEVERGSPSPEVQIVEPSSGKRWKGKGISAVAELDMVPQEITKHGYPECYDK